jgi:hypothetical protein
MAAVSFLGRLKLDMSRGATPKRACQEAVKKTEKNIKHTKLYFYGIGDVM